MLVVISPAKTLDYESPLTTNMEFSQPELIEHSVELIKICRQLTPSNIAQLMKVSDKISSLNAVRFEQWSSTFTLTNSKPAIFAFKGDVYTGFDAETLSKTTLSYAQHHLRILSGLYGVLKPLDLMQPYRLEMVTALTNARGKNLYQFWGDKITELLNQTIEKQQEKMVINLASNEYVKAINTNKLNAEIITPVFKDRKNGQYKVISFYAKKARGMMARYIMENQIESIQALKQFSCNGYYFAEEGKSSTELIFKREEQ